MAFKMRGFSGFKQYADKNVSVDKVSDDGRTFTGTDSKGNTAEFLTNAYDPEIAQSDSVGVTGNAVSNMQMEFDQVKGTEYEEGFIKHHGKGDKPGTGKSPAKQKAEAKADPKVGKQVAEWGYIPGSINKKNNTIVAEDGSLVDMAKATRGGKTLLQHLKEGTISGSPAKQTSHGPIREYKIPNNPKEGPYIVRSKPTGQTREPNNDGPDYRHIRERTGLDDGPHPQRPKSIGPSPHQAEILGGRPKQLRNYDSFVKEAGSPAKKRGLWDNIHAKRKRGEKMRKKGDKGAPTEKAIRDSQ